LLPQQRAVLQHYKKDVLGGVTVPVLCAGKPGYVSWCSRNRDRLEQGYDTSLSSIHLISHTFMRQLDRIQGESGAERGLLTRREAECLDWVARGKTSQEIASVLRRSTETVEFHLSNAMQKLNARSRAHAVAIACLRGLIGDGQHQ
jgi:DNA-binding CsgD family transcriptional regulator